MLRFVLDVVWHRWDVRSLALTETAVLERICMTNVAAIQKFMTPSACGRGLKGTLLGALSAAPMTFVFSHCAQRQRLARSHAAPDVTLVHMRVQTV